jgi:hypothetical protein
MVSVILEHFGVVAPFIWKKYGCHVALLAQQLAPGFGWIFRS